MSSLAVAADAAIVDEWSQGALRDATRRELAAAEPGAPGWEALRRSLLAADASDALAAAVEAWRGLTMADAETPFSRATPSFGWAAWMHLVYLRRKLDEPTPGDDVTRAIDVLDRTAATATRRAKETRNTAESAYLADVVRCVAQALREAPFLGNDAAAFTAHMSIARMERELWQPRHARIGPLLIAEEEARAACRLPIVFHDASRRAQANALLSDVLGSLVRQRGQALRDQLAAAEAAEVAWRARREILERTPDTQPTDELFALVRYVKQRAHLLQRAPSAAGVAALREALRTLEGHAIARPFLERGRSGSGFEDAPFGSNHDLVSNVLDVVAFGSAALFTFDLRKATLDDAIRIGDSAIAYAAASPPRNRARNMPATKGHQASRLSLRYKYYGDIKDFEQALELADQVILDPQPGAAYQQVQKTRIQTRLAHAERLGDQDSAWLARGQALRLATDRATGADTRASAWDIIATINFHWGRAEDAVQAVRNAKDAAQADQAHDARTVAAEQVIREARLSYYQCVTGDDRDANIARLDHLLKTEAPRLDTRKAVMLHRYLGEALLCRDGPGDAFDAGVVIEDAIAIAQRAIDELDDPLDKLSRAYLTNDLAGLVGYAFCRAGKPERAVAAIERATLALIRGVALGDLPAHLDTEGLARKVSPLHWFGFVGVTRSGLFVLGFQAGAWSGRTVPGSAEATLASVLRARPLNATSDHLRPLAQSDAPEGRPRRNKAWLEGLFKTVAEVGLDRALRESLGTATTATVVPLGILRDLPFHALPAFAGQRVTYSLTSQAPAPQPARPSMTRVVTSPLGPRAVRPASFTETMGEDEPGVDARRWSEADRAGFLDSAKTASHLRIGCHGKFTHATPLASFLQLADSEVSVSDILSAVELTGARSVMLSCCESGAQDVTLHRDEGIGIGQAFLAAGAAYVGSGMWEVSSPVAVLVDHLVARRVRDGAPMADAHHGALEWLRTARPRELREELDGLRARLARTTARISSHDQVAMDAARATEAHLDVMLDHWLAPLEMHAPDAPAFLDEPELLVPFILTHFGPAPPA